MLTLRASLVLLVVLSAAAGCAAQGPYRDGARSVETVVADPGLCEELRERSRHEITLAYLEIDEQGYFQDRRQVEQALAAVARGGKPKYVVVFVHGWFHSASPEDANVRRFKCALNNLQAIDGNAGEDVIGIYVGWRGQSWTLPVIKYATFWDRKNTSEEIGRGSLVEFLTRLERVAKPRPDSPNKLMLVGHSFGASVVFNAIGQILLERFLLDAERLLTERQPTAARPPAPPGAAPKGEHPQSKPGLVSGYGDLVVLVNPAIEATRIVPFFGSLNEFTKAQTDLFFDGQPPRLVILSSEGDTATRKTFPVARFFSTMLESYQDRPLPTPYGREITTRQRHLDWQTMGNVEALQTHAPLRKAEGSWDGKCPSVDPTWLPRTIADRKAEQHRKGEPVTGAGWSRTFDGTGITLAHRGVTTPSNPLWIMAVNTALLPSHSGIANPILICFFDGLLGDPKTVNPQAERFQEQRQR
jgi:pimeloyl-ACP methyl ester carboxylesterase